MGWLGAIGGFVFGFFVGQFLLIGILGGGRHLAVRSNPQLRYWLGLLNLAVAFVGGWLGYRLLAG